MHEFSICQSLVNAIVAELDKIEEPRSFKLLSARVMIGAMRQIVPDIMQTAYELMTKDTAAKGSTLEIVRVPSTAKCDECGWSGEMQDAFIRCGQCGKAGIELTGGMELYLDNLEIEPDGQD